MNHFLSFWKRFTIWTYVRLEASILHFSQAFSRNSRNTEFLSGELNKAARTLEPAYAAPFIKYFEGYSYQEIAKELDLPVGTVKTHIRVAREVLKEDLRSISGLLSA